MVLLVVVSMLSLFSAVALGFVFYADAEATASAAAKVSVSRDHADVDPEVLAAYFLAQMIYPTENIYSSLRGHELARSIYGYNPTALNFTPYNGIGRSAYAPAGTMDLDLGVSVFNLINNQSFFDPSRPIADRTVNFVRNPEFFDKIFNGPNATVPLNQAGPGYRYVGGANPPFTAYDTNNLYLAQVLADGTVLMPSFYRPWMGTAAGVAAKYTTTRPHGTWHPGFAGTLPDSDPPLGGVPGPDVKNLEFGPGMLKPNGVGYWNNDSYWLDAGFPIMTAPNGKRYRALVAPLIMDLSNRLHLWAHNNRLGAGNTHVSNSGQGATEVNSSIVLNNAAERQALMNLIYGGANGTPASPPAASPQLFSPSNTFPWHSRIDADGRDSATGNSSMQLFTGFATSSLNNVPTGNQLMQTQNAPQPVMPGGFPWAIVPGMQLTIDTGAQTEVVTVLTAPTPTSFTANFTKAHPAGTSVAFSTLFPFPNYPAGWDNAKTGGGAQDEITQKPLGLNIFNIPGFAFQAPLPASHMEQLLRHGGTNAPGVTSEIVRRMPITMSNPRNRMMGTLWNMHLDRIAASPVIPWDRTAATLPGAGPYQYTASGYPKIQFPITPPNYAVPRNYPINSDYSNEYPSPTALGTGWRSTLAQLLRVNLNRRLTDYPAQNGFSIIDVSNAGIVAQYNLAVKDRTDLAKDIYNSLIRVAGAQDPNVVIPPMGNTTPEYQAARWLAQFAVNIVDYIDNDDYVTPFRWDTQGNGEYVFGTELPRLVLNEVYGQRDNDAKGNAKGKGKGNGLLSQDVNLWVELHNPLQGTPAGQLYPRGNGVAQLAIDTNGAGAFTYPYKISFYVSSAALTTYLRDPANNLGDMDAASAANANDVMDWVATPANPVTHVVKPASGAPSGTSGSNEGYYVVGPTDGTIFPTSNPNLPRTHQSAYMSLNLPNATNVNGVTVLLRRLACPHLPYQPNGAQPLYNPYITVDYVDNVPVADFRQDNGNGNGNNNARPAYGRKHPYSAFNVPPPGNVANSQVVAQVGGMGNQPPNTFFAVNNPNEAPFAWLTHLDRPLVNQLELLHVSGFKPHELTQQFVYPVNGSMTRFQHYAPWKDPTTGLYRSLDLLGTPNNLFGSVRGGRWHGNINLNTVTELEVFRALCDAQDTQPYQGFNSTDVQNILTKIIVSRTGNPAANYAPAGFPMPNGEGKPFQSFAAGNPADTWLRPDPTNPAQPLFAVGAATNHPYQRASLFQKIFNNITTTSNVFAIWWTVGFFEVVDESVKPARLGAEIGRSENRHVRHRFFAIVDRSGLQLYSGNLSNGAAVATGTQTVTVDPNSIRTTRNVAGPWNAVKDYAIGDTCSSAGVGYFCITANRGQVPTNTAYWLPILQAGMQVEVDVGANMEVVTIKQVNAGQFVADFTLPHAANARIVVRGNPGPPTNFNSPGAAPAVPYNPRQDTNVVLHLSVIQ